MQKYNLAKVRSYADMYEDAVRLMRSKDLDAFDLTQETQAVRDAYGRDNFGQGVLLARRLVEKQVRFVEVELGGWDTHNNNYERVYERCDILDQALSALLDDLHKRGMLDETLVVLATEFGRTPDYNVNEGRDHYPKAFSCMLAGGGIRGGQVWGATDEEGREVVDGVTQIPDFNATIAYALGLPWMKLCSRLRDDLSLWLTRATPYSAVLKPKFLCKLRFSEAFGLDLSRQTAMDGSFNQIINLKYEVSRLPCAHASFHCVRSQNILILIRKCHCHRIERWPGCY